MKLVRKKRAGIKIEHNKRLLYVILGLVVLLVVVIYSLAQNSGKEQYYFLEDNECTKIYEYPDKITFSHYINLEDCEMLVIKECETDSDCVPAVCCHAESCVSVSEALDCGLSVCSAVCSGPLDCGAGSCGCVGGVCVVMVNE